MGIEEVSEKGDAGKYDADGCARKGPHDEDDPEQRIARLADGQDGNEQCAENEVEAGKEVRGQDVAERAARTFGTAVDLSRGNAACPCRGTVRGTWRSSCRNKASRRRSVAPRSGGG